MHKTRSRNLEITDRKYIGYIAMGFQIPDSNQLLKGQSFASLVAGVVGAPGTVVALTSTPNPQHVPDPPTVYEACTQGTWPSSSAMAEDVTCQDLMVVSSGIGSRSAAVKASFAASRSSQDEAVVDEVPCRVTL